MKEIEFEEPQPIAEALGGWDLQQHPDFVPLPDGQEGLQGQVGTLQRSGMTVTVYDPGAPVWEIEYGGGTYLWERGRQCYGFPAGTCGRRVDGDILCPECTVKINSDGDRRQMDDRRDEIMSEAIAAGALPPWFRTWQPPSLTPGQAAALMEIEAHPDASIWLHGLPGRGKTVLACTVLYRAWRCCRKIAICKSNTLYDSRFDRRLFYALSSADVLLFDDIEKGVMSETGVAAIHALLDARHDSRRRTIVTSERTHTEIHQIFAKVSGVQYGVSTLARLTLGKHRPATIMLDGPNLRKETTE